MKHLYILFFLTFSFTTHGQSIIGQWETFDDKTEEKKSVIEIYESNNLFFAKIVESYVSEKNAVCETCTGKNKNKPIIDLIIIENLKKDKDEFNGGTIMDPENGKTYKCYLELMNTNKLKVRGYLGFSLFGRTQYWLRKE
ncbi:DUF2147 domain-containing protein [Aurantibacter sp.]|uniref:DUF2147 domain-containing protein n=1 Tax=Aurantibacter sp. TaxID=2807103 RepID=UPI003263D744